MRATIELPGLASEAEALWYDTRRWPTFVDGLHHVDRVVGDWPQAGSGVAWESTPGGRGSVHERVTAYAPREGQTADVEDERIRGTQRVSFAPSPDGVTLTVELRYRLKKPAMALLDFVFIRRPQRESLERTLRRFAIELATEREGSV